jgi:hypothetical protein
MSAPLKAALASLASLGIQGKRSMNAQARDYPTGLPLKKVALEKFEESLVSEIGLPQNSFEERGWQVARVDGDRNSEVGSGGMEESGVTAGWWCT